MLDVLRWFAYAVPISAIGIGCLWALWTNVGAKTGEDVRNLRPPHGVTLDEAARQAIFAELYRRRRAGFRAAGVAYVLVVAALHPMYVPERLSDTTGGVAWGIGVLGGFVVGETYAATRAARLPRSAHRVAMLSPRDAATYLAPLERISQVVLTCVLATAAISLTLDVATTAAPAWVTYAMYVCWAWLATTLGVLAGQRWVLAQLPPLDDERRVLVREYATASAMQQLHKAIWAAGGIAYVTAVAIAIGPIATNGELVAAYGPLLALVGAVVGYRRWRQLPDPVWHFARATGSPT